MAKVQVVTFLDWNRAGWHAELNDAVADYLARSREEMTLAEEWMVLNAAMLGQNDLLLIVALDDAEEHVLGFCVLRAMQGTQVTGTTVNVWQAYVWPGRARLFDLFTYAAPLMVKFAAHYGAKRFTLQTRRMTAAYRRLLGELGFTPYMLTYTKEVLGDGGADEAKDDLPSGAYHGLRHGGEVPDVRPADQGHAGDGATSNKPVRAAPAGRVVERSAARRHKRAR